MTRFTYDAGGQHMKTVRPDGSQVFTPFATYERQVGVNGSDTIHRKHYLFGGEVIAIRVAGDPVSANNGLFYRYSDHLGSTAVLGKAGESSPWAGSTARYTPFGDWRAEPGQTITNHGYTGHRHDNFQTPDRYTIVVGASWDCSVVWKAVGMSVQQGDGCEARQDYQLMAWVSDSLPRLTPCIQLAHQDHFGRTPHNPINYACRITGFSPTIKDSDPTASFGPCNGRRMNGPGLDPHWRGAALSSRRRRPADRWAGRAQTQTHLTYLDHSRLTLLEEA